MPTLQVRKKEIQSYWPDLHIVKEEVEFLPRSLGFLSKLKLSKSMILNLGSMFTSFKASTQQILIRLSNKWWEEDTFSREGGKEGRRGYLQSLSPMDLFSGHSPRIRRGMQKYGSQSQGQKRHWFCIAICFSGVGWNGEEKTEKKACISQRCWWASGEFRKE